MKQATVLLLAALTFCTACSEAQTTTTAPPSTTATAAPTTSAPSSTTSTKGPPDTVTSTTENDIPYPDTSGDDWLKIATELEAYGGWLFENPRPELVKRWAVPGTPPYEELHAFLTTYAENGWRDLQGGRAEIRSADLQTMSDDGTLAQVVVVSDYDGALTVDRSGNVVKEDEDRPPRAWSWKLRNTEDGWKLIEVTFLGLAEWEEE